MPKEDRPTSAFQSATGPAKQPKDTAPAVAIGSRRTFLLLIPIGVIVGTATTMAAAAFRFLRPRPTVVSEKWLDVAPLTDLRAAKPVSKKILVEHTAGWAKSFAQHSVYVLPGNHQVLSAVCPHEGCEVAWRDEANVFTCPCHESNFAADGARLSGPARRGLDPLPSRLHQDKLQVQFRYYVNNTQERIKRG